jgi:hypothetical protein
MCGEQRNATYTKLKILQGGGGGGVKKLKTKNGELKIKEEFGVKRVGSAMVIMDSSLF